MNYLATILIRAYKLVISPVLSFMGVRCRYYPTCSEYAIICYRNFSFITATRMAVTRILRCNPMCEGGFDHPIHGDKIPPSSARTEL